MKRFRKNDKVVVYWDDIHFLDEIKYNKNKYSLKNNNACMNIKSGKNWLITILDR
jgi:hypothetical protein